MLSLAFILTLLGTVVCKSYIVWHLLNKYKTIKLIEVIKINFSLRFYTMIAPKAVVAGLRWNKYRRVSDPKYAFVLLAFEALTALTIAALVTLLFLYLDGNEVIFIEIKVITAVLCGLFIATMLLLFLLPDSKVLSKIQYILLSVRVLRYLGKLLEKWRDTVRSLEVGKKQNLLPILVVGIISHLLFLFGAYILFMSLNISIDFTTVAWIRSVVFILVSIPISFAGIGLREVGFIALFGLYGFSADDIIAYAMLALAIQFAIGLLGIFTELEYWFGNMRFNKGENGT